VVATWPSRALADAAQNPVKWLADENFRNAIIRGLLRQAPGFDILRAQDITETAGRDDLLLLKFATAEERVVVTHDVSTILPAMRELVRLESRCAPIVLVPDSLQVSAVIDDLMLLNDCKVEADWAAGAIYIPLR
jgi:hypothetical protein